MRPITAILTFCVLAAFVLSCFSLPQIASSDDLTLYNPVYQYLHMGKMTYPVHGWFDNMPVHPPVHYLQIAWLMQLGFGEFWAYKLPFLFFNALSVLLVWKTPYKDAERFALLLGLLAFIAFDPGTIRPDLTLAAAFYASLLLLNNARMTGWPAAKLFAAGFLIAYTSGLHYYACLAFLGAAVYLYGIWRGRAGQKRKISATLALFAGGLAFGLPYLLCFVLPNYHDILAAAAINQGEGGVFKAVQKHFWQYAEFEHIYLHLCGLVVPFYALFIPFWHFKIPLFAVSTAGLSISRNTRWMAATSLPLLLFIFLGSRGKSEGYYLPEMMLCLAGTGLLLPALCRRLSKRWGAKLAAIALLLPLAASLTIGLVQFVGGLPMPKDNQMHLARACNKQLLGNSATTGGRMSAWYISGGDRWHEVSQDVLNERDLSGFDLRGYFGRFDAIVETRHMSNSTRNRQNQSIPNWYLDGVLQLRGFYLSDDRGFQSELSNLVLDVDSLRGGELLGYGCKGNDTLYRYTAQPDGEHVFATFTKPKLAAHNTAVLAPLIDRMTFMGYMPLPNKPGFDPSGGGPYITELIYFAMPFEDFEKYRHLLPDSAIFKDVVRCRRSLADKNRLLEQLHQTDRQVDVLKNLD